MNLTTHLRELITFFLPLAKVFLGIYVFTACVDLMRAGHDNHAGIAFMLLALGGWAGYSLGKFAGKENRK